MDGATTRLMWLLVHRFIRFRNEAHGDDDREELAEYLCWAVVEAVTALLKRGEHVTPKAVYDELRKDALLRVEGLLPCVRTLCGVGTPHEPWATAPETIYPPASPRAAYAERAPPGGRGATEAAPRAPARTPAIREPAGRHVQVGITGPDPARRTARRGRP